MPWAHLPTKVHLNSSWAIYERGLNFWTKDNQQAMQLELAGHAQIYAWVTLPPHPWGPYIIGVGLGMRPCLLPILHLSLYRVDCFTNNAVNSSNVRPQISRGRSFSGNPNATLDDYVSYMWPLNVYLNFTPAIPSALYGQYVCRSSIGNYVRNYIHDSKCINTYFSQCDQKEVLRLSTANQLVYFCSFR